MTPRLVLTTWRLTDVDSLLAVHSDPETMRYVRHGRPDTRSEVEDLIRGYIHEHQSLGATKWRLADREGRLIGRAGFKAQGDDRELGYTIRRDRWGQGVATEIAAALVGWHRKHATTLALRAYVEPDNRASARVLEKVGFELVGTEDHRGTECLLYRLPQPARSDPRDPRTPSDQA